MSELSKNRPPSLDELSAASALFFDFDGVLVRSEPVKFECYRQSFKEVLDVDWPTDTWKSHCGFPEPEVARRICRELNLVLDDVETAAVITRKRELYRESHSRIPLMPGAIEFLEKMKDKKKFLYSGSSRYDITQITTRLGLDKYFLSITAKEDVAEQKPHPEGYLKILTLNNLVPSSVIGFEDSTAGLRALRASGAQVCQVGDMAPTTAEDFWIPDFGVFS